MLEGNKCERKNLSKIESNDQAVRLGGAKYWREVQFIYLPRFCDGLRDLHVDVLMAKEPEKPFYKRVYGVKQYV